jgi:hypothetical protein
LVFLDDLDLDFGFSGCFGFGLGFSGCFGFGLGFSDAWIWTWFFGLTGFGFFRMTLDFLVVQSFGFDWFFWIWTFGF